MSIWHDGACQYFASSVQIAVPSV